MEETREPRLVFVALLGEVADLDRLLYQANTDPNSREWGSVEEDAVKAVRAILPNCKMFDSFEWVPVGPMTWAAAVLA